MEAPTVSAEDIAGNLAAVKQKITEAATAVGRSAADISLVAVTKTHGAARIRPAISAGHRMFGENRVQEAEEKWPALKAEQPDVRLHLIGPLQRNKARRAVRLFDVIESVDSERLAHHLADVMGEEDRRPDVLIQVNTGEEPSKAGVSPLRADALIRTCRDELALPLRGLMCIPPIDEEPSLHFALLREIARRHELADLSMGMTADYPVAIQFGATLVRVGTAIFGARPPIGT